MDDKLQEKIDSLVQHFHEAQMESPDSINAHANELGKMLTPQFLVWLDKQARLCSTGHMSTGEVMCALVLANAKLVSVFLHVAYNGDDWCEASIAEVCDTFVDCMKCLARIHNDDQPAEPETIQ